MALGAKFISTKVVQCCGEKDSPLYCCYIAPPDPLNKQEKIAKPREYKGTNMLKSPPFFHFARQACGVYAEFHRQRKINAFCSGMQ